MCFVCDLVFYRKMKWLNLWSLNGISRSVGLRKVVFVEHLMTSVYYKVEFVVHITDVVVSKSFLIMIYHG